MILDELIELNNQRKEIEKNLTKEAIRQVSPNSNIAIVWGEDWNEGVVGIVASKVANHFKMPSIVLSCKDGICKGSGRSWGECNLYELASRAKEYYLKFGGHKSAIGVSFEKEKLNLIKNILNIEASKICDKDYKDLSILGILPFSQIDFELLDILDKFEPYGEANPSPKFIAKAEVIEASDVGESKEHRRYRLKDFTNRVVSAIEFRSNSRFNVGDRVLVTFTLSKNEYNGSVYINLYIQEILLDRN